MSKDLAIARRVKWWAGVYEYHQQQAPGEEVLKQYARDLLAYSGEEVNRAWENWRVSSGFAPKPGDLIPLMAKKLQLEDRAQLYAGHLHHCVSFYSKYGTCYPDAAEKWIREHIGDIGWLVVEQLGGWKSLWSRSEKLDPEKTIGSWRKMFHSMLVSEEVDGPIALPSRKESKQIMGDIGLEMKEIK